MAYLKIFPPEAPALLEEESIKKFSLMEEALLSRFRRIGVA